MITVWRITLSLLRGIGKIVLKPIIRRPVLLALILVVLGVYATWPTARLTVQQAVQAHDAWVAHNEQERARREQLSRHVNRGWDMVGLPKPK